MRTQVLRRHCQYIENGYHVRRAIELSEIALSVACQPSVTSCFPGCATGADLMYLLYYSIVCIVYISKSRGKLFKSFVFLKIMYKIKQVNEDFKVFEESAVKPEEKGEYQYFTLEKNGLNTPESIFLLSEKLKIPKKFFGYAGNKDKRAATKQIISIQTNMDIGTIESNRLKLTYLGKGNERINLGSHEGNGFEIVVRNLENEEESDEINFIPNYFDTQRFSTLNVEIGEAILARNFEKAVNLLLQTLEGTDIFYKITKRLEKNPHDFVSCLRDIDKKTLMLYIHSVQSYLFNYTLSESIKSNTEAYKTVSYPLGEFYFSSEKPEDFMLALPGFGTEIGDDDIDMKLMEKMDEMSITTRSFVIKEIPELSSEGVMRNAFVEVSNLSISDFDDDELNEGKKKCTVKFSLPKGSYATIVVKSMFG